MRIELYNTLFIQNNVKYYHNLYIYHLTNYLHGKTY